MLNLRKVLGAKPKKHVEAQLATLYTPQGEALDPSHVWEQHPDPQFERLVFQTLNGLWECAFVPSGHEPTGNLESIVAAAIQPADGDYPHEIVVPFSPEAVLSGVNRQLQPDELLWYRRRFIAPELGATSRCLLHFQAVDYACACRVNGQLVGTHAGGYTPFTFDITDYLEGAENELAVCVADPSEFGGQLRGKQRFDRGDIWYTAQSGIWQTVWIEVVPAAHVERLQIEPDASSGILAVGAVVTSGLEVASAISHVVGAHAAGAHSADAHSAGAHAAHQQAAFHMFKLEVFTPDGALVAACEEPVDGPVFAVALHIPAPHLWSPDDPYLYRLRVRYGDDEVSSYCAFRTVELCRDAEGHPRVFLNGAPLFIRGVLDQAYWPDGLMTAPSDEALLHDIKAMRDAGFNLMRKHIKVENARWYYHCDRLGMLVLQDMVQGGDAGIHSWDWSYKPTLFKCSWSRFRDDTLAHQRKLGAGGAAYRDEWMRTCRETVQQLRNHPSIIGWSLFNEGWGQFDARSATKLVRRLDPTRLIDAVSGWYDQHCGDFKSVHNYFRPLSVWPSKQGRAFIVSEFGGYSHRVEGHSSLDGCYGYETYEDLSDWRASVRALLAHMDALEGKGLAGYIYTQVSDIEEETNGLLTYDRRVNKLR